MKLLVIGKSGREHALVTKLAKSKKLKKIYVASGNGGTASTKKVENVNIDIHDLDNLVKFAKENDIDFATSTTSTVLILGAYDQFTEAGIKFFGPSKQAAQVEGSKIFSKGFMKQHKIPTPDHEAFSNIDKAVKYIEKHGANVVVKAEEVEVCGHGVKICKTEEDAINAITTLLNQDQINNIIIEEFIAGTEEVSFTIITDGETVLTLPPVRDYKKREDGETGVMTDGIGSFSPVKYVDKKMEQRILDELIYPTLTALKEDGIVYKGFLYVGIMIDRGDPKVLEYNCRLGDPEAEVILSKISSNMFDMFEAGYNGTLNEYKLKYHRSPTVCVTVVDEHYPGEIVPSGNIIIPSKFDKRIEVYQAGTELVDGNIVSTGGRILNVVATAKTIEEAKTDVYDAINQIKFDCNVHFRTDVTDVVSDQVELKEQIPELVDDVRGEKGLNLDKIIVDKTLLAGDEQLIPRDEWVEWSEMNDTGKILNNPIFETSFERVMDQFKPTHRVAFVSLCTATRPYNRSRKWKEFKESFDGHADLIVLSNAGVIPEKFWKSYPYLNYDGNSLAHDNVFYPIITRRIQAFFEKHRYEYIVANFRPKKRLRFIMTEVLNNLEKKGIIEEWVVLPTFKDYNDLKKREFPDGKMFPDLDEKIFSSFKEAVYEYSARDIKGEIKKTEKTLDNLFGDECEEKEESKKPEEKIENPLF